MSSTACCFPGYLSLLDLLISGSIRKVRIKTISWCHFSLGIIFLLCFLSNKHGKVPLLIGNNGSCRAAGWENLTEQIKMQLMGTGIVLKKKGKSFVIRGWLKKHLLFCSVYFILKCVSITANHSWPIWTAESSFLSLPGLPLLLLMATQLGTLLSGPSPST